MNVMLWCREYSLWQVQSVLKGFEFVIVLRRRIYGFVVLWVVDMNLERVNANDRALRG
jgi:hypothetical protein